MKPPATPREWIAPLRHRYTQLFDELGIEVRWDVPASWIVPPSALQCLALTRLIEEGRPTSSSTAAPGASRCAWRNRPRALELMVEDDGAGFDVAAVCQAGISVGMRSMSTRIAGSAAACGSIPRPAARAPDRQPDPGGGRRRGGPGDGFGARCIEKSHPDVIPGTQPHICKVLTANPTTIAVIHKFQQDDASWMQRTP